MIDKPRIALICGHFLPQLGYAEVHLARTFALLGYSVRVFTSSVTPSYVRQVGNLHPNKLEQGVEVTFVPHLFSAGQVVIPRGLAKSVHDFSPDAAVLIGVGKVWPRYALPALRNIPTAVLVGDNFDSYDPHAGLVALKHWAMRKFFKAPAYRQIGQSNTKVFNYTLEAFELIEFHFGSATANALRKRAHAFRLGFNPQVYTFSAGQRLQQRAAWQVNSDTAVFITATRATPGKRLEILLRWFDNLAISNAQYRVYGVQNDAYGHELRAICNRMQSASRIHLLPALPQHELAAAYQGADVGLWPQKAITIQEALGTGLPVYLVNRHSETETGYPALEWLPETFNPIDLPEKNETRQLRAQHAASLFGWPALCTVLLNNLGLRE